MDSRYSRRTVVLAIYSRSVVAVVIRHQQQYVAHSRVRFVPTVLWIVVRFTLVGAMGWGVVLLHLVAKGRINDEPVKDDTDLHSLSFC